MIPSDVGLGPYDLPSVSQHSVWGSGSDGDLSEWRAGGDLNVEMRNGAIVGHSIGTDPILQGPDVALEAEAAGQLIVRMKADADDHAQLFWSTTALPVSESNSVHFEVIGDGKYHDYKVDLSRCPGWTGLVTSLRLDPVAKSGTKFTIESIRIL